MPGYETHSRRAIQVGVLTAVVVGSAAFWTTATPAVAVVTAVLAFAGARVGGNAPDIDSHSSVPRRYFDRSLQVLTAAAVVGGAFLFYDGILEAAETTVAAVAPSLALPPIAVGALAVGLLGVTAMLVAPRMVAWVMPSHRGLLHNPLLWTGVGIGVAGAVFLGLVLGGVATIVATWVGGAIGGGLTAGALFAHLLPDGELI